MKEVEEVERVLPELREKDLVTLRRQRNIGVSAHIDSGEFSSSPRLLWLFGVWYDSGRGNGEYGAVLVWCGDWCLALCVVALRRVAVWCSVRGIRNALY